MVTSISESAQHVILVGDEDQLRPQANSFELEINNCDIRTSLFERMIKAGFPHVCLRTQYKIPLNIHSIVTKNFYPGISFESRQMSSSEVIDKIMSSNLYFINHDNFESTHSTTNSNVAPDFIHLNPTS